MEAVGWSVLVQVSEVGRGRVVEVLVAVLAAGQGHSRASTQQKNQYLLLGVRRNRRDAVTALQNDPQPSTGAQDSTQSETDSVKVA